MKPGVTQVMAALIASAAAGGLATAAGTVLIMATRSFAYGPPSFTAIVTGGMMAVVMVLLLGFYTTIIFAIGLVVIGLPAWATLHRLGFRSRAAAILTGGVLTGTAATARAFALDPSNSGAGSFGLLMVLPGAVAGWTLHRVAYGKAGPKPA